MANLLELLEADSLGCFPMSFAAEAIGHQQALEQLAALLQLGLVEVEAEDPFANWFLETGQEDPVIILLELDS